MWSSGAWWYLAGWLVGWLLLWRTRPLPTPHASRPPTAVVVPARDEEPSLPRLLPTLISQVRPMDELVVVDDHSADATAAVARRAGARVVAAPDLPAGWRGKPHACVVGASATEGSLLVFVDADVHPSPDLLDRLGAAIGADPDALVSVQPWHLTERPYEQLSLLPGVVAMMAAGRWAIVASRRPLAFGPVMAVRREVYERSGGHAGPTVRAAVVEDVALARAVGRSVVFGGCRQVSFRMYPSGWRATIEGWSRSMAFGVTAAPWWAALGAAAWITSLAGGMFATPLAYPLSALQVWALGRRVGRFRWWAPLAYPLLTAAFVLLVLRAAALRLRGRGIVWKGRDLG
jgi:4,4'-diaponeurosporenoate glycosyltransferase